MIFAIFIREVHMHVHPKLKKYTSNVFSIHSEILTTNNFEHLIILAQHN
jgi:hypothetical protein